MITANDVYGSGDQRWVPARHDNERRYLTMPGVEYLEDNTVEIYGVRYKLPPECNGIMTHECAAEMVKNRRTGGEEKSKDASTSRSRGGAFKPRESGRQIRKDSKPRSTQRSRGEELRHREFEHMYGKDWAKKAHRVAGCENHLGIGSDDRYNHWYGTTGTEKRTAGMHGIL